MSNRQRNVLVAKDVGAAYCPFLCWSDSDGNEQQWLPHSPALVPWARSRRKLGMRLRRQSSFFVSAPCVAISLPEESQAVQFVVAQRCGHWPNGKRSSAINSFSFPMRQLGGESTDLIWELKLTKPYPQLLVCSSPFSRHTAYIQLYRQPLLATWGGQWQISMHRQLLCCSPLWAGWILDRWDVTAGCDQCRSSFNLLKKLGLAEL